MKNINGIEIQKLSFTAQKLGDLIYYEGPLLSLYIDTENPGLYYLYKWADCDEKANRWLITQTNEAAIRRFFLRQDSLRGIIQKNVIAYVIDLNDDLETIGILVSSVAELPSEYLPDVRSYFTEERYSEFAREFKATIRPEKVYSLPTQAEPTEDYKRTNNYPVQEQPVNEKLIEVLNDLIEINNDRVQGYQKAVE